MMAAVDRRIGACGFALLLGWLLSATPASAGLYNVYACATPQGKFTNHSWGLVSNASQFQTVSCPGDGSVVIQSEADKLYEGGQSATMTFQAPGGATIADFRLHRYLFHFNPIDGSPGREYLFTVG